MEHEEFSVDAFKKYSDINIKLLAKNDPYQLELTEESLLLDYFFQYMEKGPEGTQVNESIDEEEQREAALMESFYTELTRQANI